MKRKDIISITGDLASGQSTVAKMLAEDLNYYLYKNVIQTFYEIKSIMTSAWPNGHVMELL